MNPARFIRKCLTDREAALRSAKIVARQFYGRLYWTLKPHTPLRYQLPHGGCLLLEPKHAFTGCFWPDVEQYEPDVCQFLRCVLKPGGTFIDCGANVGLFSVQAGALVGSEGTVVSIEANPRTYQLLERNLRVNGFGIPVHCALTSEIGEAELFVPGSWDVYSSLRAASVVEGVADNSFRVKARTLDDVVEELALSSIDLVKIDIEGGELDVLESAPKVLSVLRPAFVVEYGVKTWASFGATYERLEELMRQHDYRIRLFDPQREELIPLAADVWQSVFVNIILIPGESKYLSERAEVINHADLHRRAAFQ